MNQHQEEQRQEHKDSKETWIDPQYHHNYLKRYLRLSIHLSLRMGNIEKTATLMVIATLIIYGIRLYWETL